MRLVLHYVPNWMPKKRNFKNSLKSKIN